MKISFHGAAGGVTGSCFLVECAGLRILVDCGLYQGGRELREENAEPFGFEPEEVDFVLLTHAHLDHCGRLPLLKSRGFRGEIIATGATRDLARLVLLDSAGIQEEDARRRQRRAERRGKRRKRGQRHELEEPLYTTLDALDTMDAFGRSASYGKPLALAPGLTATYLDAGHILGASSVLLELEEKGRRRKVIFSGDLGYGGRPILRDPDTPPAADVVVMESTYGNRQHRPLESSVEELYEAITGTFARGGNVIIPSFALERAQEVLYHLREGVGAGRLPASMQVFLDSPMAISATEIFRRHPECYDEETSRLFLEGKDPFHLPGLHFTHETAESMAINRIAGGAVIIAGSGMCTGGRVRHHLKHNLWRAESSIVFVGFAARGTLGRRIIDGEKRVTIFDEEIHVRARVHTLGGFSAHADQAELLAWHAKTGEPEITFVVHGEDETRQIFAKMLQARRVETPALHETFDL